MRLMGLLVAALSGLAVGVEPSLMARSTVQTPAVATAGTPAELRFSSASLKRNTTNPGPSSFRALPNGGYEIVNESLYSLLSTAYGVSVERGSVPNWVLTERYDIVATSPLIGAATTPQRQAMLRAFLIETFNLVTHLKPHREEAYDLVLAHADEQVGPEMAPTPVDCARREEPAGLAQLMGALRSLPDGESAPDCAFRNSGDYAEGDVRFPSGAGLLTFIRNKAGRPVIDRTGLIGFYRLRLSARKAPSSTDSAPAVVDETPDIFSALPAQLGLKLEESTTYVSTLVVDRVEQPRAN